MSPPNGERRPLVTDGEANPGKKFTASLNATNDIPQSARRLRWPPIIDRAAEIVRSYDTGVTLRQLHYRLVSEQLTPNTEKAYKRLSSLTAVGRRRGTFPDLIDRGRTIHSYQHFAGPCDALNALQDWYRLDRTAGQDVSCTSVSRKPA